MDLPQNDELEVTVFGKGVGECAVVHLGDGQWLVVDSFLDSTRTPVAYNYLIGIGLDPIESVKHIAITHWHDDHVRGVSNLLSKCKNAKFYCSAALASAEYYKMYYAYNKQKLVVGGTGVDEMVAVFQELKASRRVPIRAIADRPIMGIASAGTSVVALSPSDLQFDESCKEILKMLPEKSEGMRRATPNDKNNTSMVLQVLWEHDSALLGGDLEETSHPLSGWSAIVNSTLRPTENSTVFKVPHHGSKNGHSAEVWAEMLSNDVIALVTPYSKSKLPTNDDVQRIKHHASDSYVAGTVASGPKGNSGRASKMIKDFTQSYVEYPVDFGYVRLRKAAGQASWQVEISGSAHQL